MLRYSLLLGLTVSEFTPEEGLRKSLELFPGNFQELVLKNFFWKFPRISTNLVAIFSGYSPELVTRNSLELVTRNSLEWVMRNSSK